MSRKIAALVYTRRAGSMIRKALLAYFAERANDDGTGVWASKQRIADEIEASRRAVITNIQEMVNEGLLIEVGKRSFENGYTMEYAMNLKAIAALPESDPDDPCKIAHLEGGDVKEVHGGGEGGSRQDVKEVHTNRPLTVLEPSNKADRFEEAWSLYTSCPLKANQTKKRAKQQWSKAVARAGSEDRIINSIRIEVRKRTGTKDFIANLPDMHRWLSQDRWQDVEPAKPDLLTPAASGNSELLDKLFKAFAQTGQWYGNKHKLPFDPHHPEADYPKALYQKHGISKQKQGAGDV